MESVLKGIALAVTVEQFSRHRGIATAVEFMCLMAFGAYLHQCQILLHTALASLMSGHCHVENPGCAASTRVQESPQQPAETEVQAECMCLRYTKFSSRRFGEPFYEDCRVQLENIPRRSWGAL